MQLHRSRAHRRCHVARWPPAALAARRRRRKLRHAGPGQQRASPRLGDASHRGRRPPAPTPASSSGGSSERRRRLRRRHDERPVNCGIVRQRVPARADSAAAGSACASARRPDECCGQCCFDLTTRPAELRHVRHRLHPAAGGNVPAVPTARRAVHSSRCPPTRAPTGAGHPHVRRRRGRRPAASTSRARRRLRRLRQGVPQRASAAASRKCCPRATALRRRVHRRSTRPTNCGACGECRATGAVRRRQVRRLHDVQPDGCRSSTRAR